MSDFNTTVRQLAERHRSFYIYRQSMIEDNIRALKSSFKNAQFLYSVKTNPFEPVLKTVVRQGLGFDAASLNEVLMGEKLGLARDKIYYSAPGKTRDDIVGAAGRSVIIADSLNELEMLQSVAKETGKKLDTGIRINPDFTLGSESGVSSKFGIDVGGLLFQVLHSLLHDYTGGQQYGPADMGKRAPRPGGGTPFLQKASSRHR